MAKAVRVKRVKVRRRATGKGKGSAFEREVCKKLSLWVSRGKSTDLFWRTAMSGGRATVQRKRGVVVRQSGDITAVTAEGHALTDRFYMECKFYKRIDLAQWIINNEGKIVDWWTRAKREARDHGKQPMLIVKQNHWPILVITRPRKLEAQPLCEVFNRNAELFLFSDMVGVPFA